MEQKNFLAGEVALLRPNGQPGVYGAMAAYPKIGAGGGINDVNLPGKISSGKGLIVYYTTKVRIIQGFNNDNTFLIKVENPTAAQAGEFMVSAADLQLDPEQVAIVAKSLQSTSEAEISGEENAVNNFFSDTQNAIFKSFNSVKGRGLAGFIKSLNFDYNQTVWETDRYNARAPMMLKITMEFAPIHDINPGLDSNGFTTAPIYNVGSLSKAYYNDNANNNQETSETRFNQSRAAISKIR